MVLGVEIEPDSSGQAGNEQDATVAEGRKVKRALCVAALASVSVVAVTSRASEIVFVAQAEVDRPVGYDNIADATGLAFVPGSRFGAGQADRLVFAEFNFRR